MELEQLLQRTELVPRPVLCAEVFCIHRGVVILRGLAPSREYLQLHSQLHGKPWLLMLEKAHDHRLYESRRPGLPIHKYIGHLFRNGGTALFHIIVIAISPLYVNWALHRPSKWQKVGVCTCCCCCCVSKHLQVWFHCYYGDSCLSLCV